MYKYLTIVIISLLCILQKSFSQKLTKLWETDSTIKTPESVLYDSKDKVIYVACINGKPTLENNQSFIAKLGLDGKTIKLKFTDNLNSTKGMGILDNKLYVTEIFKLVEIDLKSGKVLNKYDVPEAKFLNDIAIDSKNGIVYLTDSRGNRVWSFKNGQMNKLLEGDQITNPNGVFIENDALLIGNGDGTLLKYNTKTKVLSKIAEGMGGIDGIASDGKGNYFASEWKGIIWFINADGTKKELINSVEQKISTADLDYAIDKKMLFVPTFYHNSVAVYSFSE